MTLAVVIPTHNRPALLLRALESVYAQIPPPKEIVVIDDGSSPTVTSDVFRNAPPGVTCTLLVNAIPAGANAARNRGIACASSDYIAFLDDDDEFLGGKCAALEAAIVAQSPDVIYHAARVEYDKEGIGYDTRPKPAVSFEQLLVANGIGGTSVGCIKKDLLHRIGGFSEELPALQDWDLWLRAAEAGARFMVLDGVYTRYHFVTGEAAISKSIANLDGALASINARYASQLKAMSPRQRRHRARQDAIRYAHRFSVRGENLKAARAFFQAALRGRSPQHLLAAVAALFGLKSLATMRSWLNRA